MTKAEASLKVLRRLKAAAHKSFKKEHAVYSRTRRAAAKSAVGRAEPH
jgi:hypothetical protein